MNEGTNLWMDAEISYRTTRIRETVGRGRRHPHHETTRQESRNGGSWGTWRSPKSAG